jgi:hypothetical protein
MGLLAVSAIWLAASGCLVKRTVKIVVPQGIRQAKTAGFDELLAIIRGYDKINTLSCSDMELTFTSLRKRDAGELEKYRSLRGYILLRRPDSVHFVLLIPITKSRFVDVLSVGDRLSVWSPRENRFYEGKNSAKELVFEETAGSREFKIPIRGPHIIEAIFPQSIGFDFPGIWLGVDEQTDGRVSYYVLTVSKEGSGRAMPRRIHTLRKIWIERFGLTIARQQVFGDEGEMVSDILYSDEVQIDGSPLPLQIHIDRPVDGYMLDLKFKGWSINPELPDDAFELTAPPGAETVRLKEKGRSGTS